MELAAAVRGFPGVRRSLNSLNNFRRRPATMKVQQATRVKLTNKMGNKLPSGVAGRHRQAALRKGRRHTLMLRRRHRRNRRVLR